MKVNIKAMLVLAAALAMIGCSHEKNELAHHHEHEHGHVHGHDHEEGEEEEPGEIVLHPEMAEKFGVETIEVVPGDFRESLAVSGQIEGTPASTSVVSAPTSGIVSYAPGMQVGAQVSAGTAVATISAKDILGGNANESARVAMEAAKRELDRVTPLHQAGVVSTKDYNAAKLAYEQALAAYSPKAATGRATASTSGVITQLLIDQGGFVEAGAPIATVGGNQKITLRADLPERYFSVAPQLASANIAVPYDDEVVSIEALNGRRNGGAVASSNGYLPIYFSFDNNGKFAVGSFVKAYLLGATRHNVLSVPVAAISEQQGAYFVYEQIDDECYRKLPVKIGNNNGVMVEIVEGLRGGEKIVSNAVVAVRLAETSAVAPEGHSHNH